MKKHIPKILIVDDDQLYLTQFKTILREEIQANCFFSDNARDALKLINKNCFAIILLDVNIPGKSGFELAKDVRNSKLNKHTPIIFITGISIDNSVLEGYKAGAVDYLSKPVNKFILFGKINTFLMLDYQKNELLNARNKLTEINENLERQINKRTQQLKKELNRNIRANKELRAVANQLNENYHFLEILIETIPNPVYYKDYEGKYIGCNKAFEKFISAKKEDIIGKAIYSFTSKDYADKITELDTELIKSKKSQVTEIKFPVSDGNFRELVLYKNPFVIPHSDKIGIIGTIIDVTELTKVKGIIKIQHTIDYLSSMEKGQKNVFINILNSIFEFDWVDSAGIYIMDEEKQDLTLVAHKGLSKKFVSWSKHFARDTAQVKLVLSEKPFYSSYEKLKEFPNKEIQNENIKALVVIPLFYNQKVIGSLNLASKTKESISQIDKKGIESLSSRIGNLIVYAQTQERLKIHQKELERKIEERTKVLRESNIKLNEEIKFHKKTKIALAESEQKYRGIFENAQDGIVLYDAETLQLVEVNKKAYESLGYTYAEFKNLRYDEFTIHKYKNERKELIEQLLLKGNITFQAKHRKKNGEISHRIVNASVLTINDKKYIQGAIHDISDIIEKELALQKSEKRYKDLQSNIPIGIWTTNLEGKFLYINKAVKKMLGLDPKRKAINLSVTDIYYNSSERSEFVKQIQRTGYIKNKEMQFLRKDKSVFWGKVSANAVFDDDQKLMWIDGVVEDITEKKEAQLKLLKAHHEIKLINRNLKKKIKDAFEEEKQQHQYMIQKSKIESLGELAAGIAHEINQPLGVMSLSMENLQMKISSNRATAGYLQNKFKSIESNINRIRKIVDHIRTFSYESSSNSLQKVNINKGISNALLLIGTQYQNHNINIKLDLQENIGFTIGNNQKFEQVVLNLLSNAKYAVEECATNYCESEYSKNITIKTCATEKKISVSVKDNGIGIKSEYLTKVFDPFFTSKPEGIGTGLGLSIVYGIIKEMRGEIVIDSEWNKFTKVKISFPRFPENS